MKRDAMEDRAGDLMALAQSIKDDVMASNRHVLLSFDPDVQTADVQVAIRRRVRYKDGIRGRCLDNRRSRLFLGVITLTFPVCW